MSKTHAVMETNKYPQIILASTSKYRSELLNKLKIPFETANPGIDETPFPGESPTALASRLALAKSRAIHPTLPHSLVIGSDQVASIDHQLLGKPGSMDQAIDQLTLSSGRCVEFHTALTVTQHDTGESRSRLETTRVHFRALSRSQIVRYLEAEQPFDCAGSFKSEGLGIALFRQIDGRDPNALIGLPLIALVEILSEWGLVIP